MRFEFDDSYMRLEAGHNNSSIGIVYGRQPEIGLLQIS